MPSRLFCLFDITGRHRLRDKLAQVIGDVSEVSETFQKPHRILTFLPRVLEDAGHSRSAPAFTVFGELGLGGNAAGHAHVLAQIVELDIGGPRQHRRLEHFAIDRAAGRKAVGVEDEGVGMEFETVL